MSQTRQFVIASSYANFRKWCWVRGINSRDVVCVTSPDRIRGYDALDQNVHFDREWYLNPQFAQIYDAYRYAVLRSHPPEVPLQEVECGIVHAFFCCPVHKTHSSSHQRCWGERLDLPEARYYLARNVHQFRAFAKDNGLDLTKSHYVSNGERIQGHVIHPDQVVYLEGWEGHPNSGMIRHVLGTCIRKALK